MNKQPQHALLWVVFLLAHANNVSKASTNIKHMRHRAPACHIWGCHRVSQSCAFVISDTGLSLWNRTGCAALRRKTPGRRPIWSMVNLPCARVAASDRARSHRQHLRARGSSAAEVVRTGMRSPGGGQPSYCYKKPDAHHVLNSACYENTFTSTSPPFLSAMSPLLSGQASVTLWHSLAHHKHALMKVKVYQPTRLCLNDSQRAPTPGHDASGGTSCARQAHAAHSRPLSPRPRGSWMGRAG